MSSPNPMGHEISGAIFPSAEAQEHIALLEDKDWQIRLSAIEALAKIRDPEAVAPLLALLKDKRSQVRGKAARALGHIGDLRAVEPLTKAYKEWKWWERNSTGFAVLMLGSPAELPLLILSSTTLSPTQKAASLQGLIGITVGIAGIGHDPFSVRFEIRNVQAFCENLCRQSDTEESVKQGAEAVLAELQNRTAANTLLRAGTRDVTQEEQTLLRGASDKPGVTRPEELLRSSRAVQEQTKREKPGLLSRIFKRR